MAGFAGRLADTLPLKDGPSGESNLGARCGHATLAGALDAQGSCAGRPWTQRILLIGRLSGSEVARSLAQHRKLQEALDLLGSLQSLHVPATRHALG